MNTIKEIVKSVMFLEYIGIFIENINEYECNFSVPKSSNFHVDNSSIKEQLLKYSNDLVNYAKKEILTMLNLNESSNYSFNYTIRDEHWCADTDGETRLKYITSDISKTVYKLNSKNIDN